MCCFVEDIRTQKDFDEYVAYLENLNLPNNIEWELYNFAVKQLYGHPAFDENGNVIE